MNSNILLTLNLSLLLVSLLAVESRNLRTATFFYFIHSIFLFSIIVSFAYFFNNPTLYLWGVVCFITKVIIIPSLLWHYVKKVPVIEYRPFIGFMASFFIIAVLAISFFKLFQTAIDFLAPTQASTQEPVRSLLASAFTVFSLGMYALVSRRDAVKTVIGLALLENGVHLTLLCLVPNLSETTMIGILTNVTVIVFILLYLSMTIYEVFGSTDTAKLSELKY
jgi:hydrogenase-4 component E